MDGLVEVTAPGTDDGQIHLSVCAAHGGVG
jgi:hypothetical protein